MTNLLADSRANEVLDVLRECAKSLLSAYDKTMSPVYLAAFERTAEACETLYFEQAHLIKKTIH